MDFETLSDRTREKIEEAVRKMSELSDAVEEALGEIRLEGVGAPPEKREFLKNIADALSEAISGFEDDRGINPCLEGDEALKNDSVSSEGHLNDLGGEQDD